MRSPRTLLMLVLAALLCPWPGSTSLAFDEEVLNVDIKVSPRKIVLFATRQGNWLTIHADLPYADVDLDSLTVNDFGSEQVEFFTKRDDCGDLVVKVRLRDLIKEGQLAPGVNEVWLDGQTSGDEPVPFTGIDQVFVRSKPGKK